jgi:predicted RNA-binding Zn ribbon-like protein
VPNGRSAAHTADGDRYRPKTGRLCLELVATVRSRLGEIPQDNIADTAGLADWLVMIGLPTTQPPAETDIPNFRALRESIYRLAAAVTNDAPWDPAHIDADITLINNQARGHHPPVTQLRVESSPQGIPTMVGQVAQPTVAQVLTMLACDTVDMLTGPEIDRLHQCQASSCGSFYLDTSRGGQRRWCSSASCGNRVRVAAHRHRHRD